MRASNRAGQVHELGRGPGVHARAGSRPSPSGRHRADHAPAFSPAQQVRRHPDRVAPVVAHFARDAEQIRRAAERRQLDQHRQVDAGDDLDAIRSRGTSCPGSTACPRTCRSAAARRPRRGRVRSACAMSSRASLTSSCQPIDTAVNCGRSPTIISAAVQQLGRQLPVRDDDNADHDPVVSLRLARLRLPTTSPVPSRFMTSRCRPAVMSLMPARPCAAVRRSSPSVPPAGAADRDRQVALALRDVVRAARTPGSPSADP